MLGCIHSHSGLMWPVGCGLDTLLRDVILINFHTQKIQVIIHLAIKHLFLARETRINQEEGWEWEFGNREGITKITL